MTRDYCCACDKIFEVEDKYGERRWFINGAGQPMQTHGDGSCLEAMGIKTYSPDTDPIFHCPEDDFETGNYKLVSGGDGEGAIKMPDKVIVNGTTYRKSMEKGWSPFGDSQHASYVVKREDLREFIDYMMWLDRRVWKGFDGEWRIRLGVVKQMNDMRREQQQISGGPVPYTGAE